MYVIVLQSKAKFIAISKNSINRILLGHIWCVGLWWIRLEHNPKYGVLIFGISREILNLKIQDLSCPKYTTWFLYLLFCWYCFIQHNLIIVQRTCTRCCLSLITQPPTSFVHCYCCLSFIITFLQSIHCEANNSPLKWAQLARIITQLSWTINHLTQLTQI